MEDDHNFFEKGRRSQFFFKWKIISIFLKIEDDLKKIIKKKQLKSKPKIKQWLWHRSTNNTSTEHQVKCLTIQHYKCELLPNQGYPGQFTHLRLTSFTLVRKIVCIVYHRAAKLLSYLNRVCQYHYKIMRMGYIVVESILLHTLFLSELI